MLWASVAFAFPGTELELALEQQPDVGDCLDVGGEAGVCLPGPERGLGDLAAAAGQPDKRRQVDGELGALRPAGIAPAVAQAARGAVGAADQSGQLVEGDGVLLSDQPEQLDVPFRDLVAASVPPCSPPSLSLIRERLCCQCRLLLYLCSDCLDT